MPETFTKDASKKKIDKILAKSLEIRVSDISTSIENAKTAIELSVREKYLNGEGKSVV